jgi:hypothetical protein
MTNAARHTSLAANGEIIAARLLGMSFEKNPPS